MTDLPKLALSVRQPWAWAIIHAGKDIENRDWGPLNPGLRHRGRVAIHAAKGMLRGEYERAMHFMRALGITCPPPADLLRGGIIGSVEVINVATRSSSPWFSGPWGLVLDDPQPCKFVPAIGALGFFEWRKGDIALLQLPAKWMLHHRSMGAPAL
jgi:hypothetical protein